MAPRTAYAKPSADEAEATTEKTKAALARIIEEYNPTRAAQPKLSQYIKYTPFQQSSAYNSGASERVIRMVEMPKDPLHPPKIKHKRVPTPYGPPPVPLMHSPPRPVTVKDQQDWKIPPCISNWKNPMGYTIPLDKRMAADGRSLREVQINNHFAELVEAMYVAEHKSREAVDARRKVQEEITMKEKEMKEAELRMLAQRSRMERAEVSAAPAAAEERRELLEREALRGDRRRERDRERTLEAKEGPAKKKTTVPGGRNISEKMALGMANTGAGGGELTYDQRLFNQEMGLELGFAADDIYNVYDKRLWASQSVLNGLYHPPTDIDGEELLGKATERGEPRNRPVEFGKDDGGEDPFGLNRFLAELKKGKKLALDAGSSLNRVVRT